MYIRRRNWSRKAATVSNAELTSHTSPFCNDYNKLQPFAFLVFVFLFPHAKNCAFIFLTHVQVRLFLTCGSPCVCSTSDCAMLLRSRRIKRGGIMSEWHLSMRVLSVVPRHAVTVGSLKGGTVIWARRVKQFVQWTDCSQSEQGGLLRKRRSPNT